MNRRNFLKVVGFTAAGTMVPLKLIAGKRKQGLAGGNIRLSITENGVMDYWYYQVPVEQVTDGLKASWTTVDNIKITAYEDFRLDKIEFRVPETISKFWAELGMEKEWIETPAILPALITKDNDLTITFNTQGIFSIS